MSVPPTFANTGLIAPAQLLLSWAQTFCGAVGIQVWVADDIGLHPRAVIGRNSNDGDRHCARLCCVQGRTVAVGPTLAVPLKLSDPSTGACVFLLPGPASDVSAAIFEEQVHAFIPQFDGLVQSERIARLSGLARKSDLLRSTLTLAHALEDCADLAGALGALHASLKAIMDAENFFVVVLDEGRQNLIFEYLADAYDDDRNPIPFHDGRLQGSLSALVVSAGRVLRGSSRELLEFAGHVDTLEDYGYGPNASDWLGVPMVVANESFGALVVQSYEPALRFAEEDPSLLSMVAEAVAAALHRRRVRAALERTVAERTAQVEQSNRKLQDTVCKLERAMNELVQAEKLASLGAMVAGISHELNTPIGVALTVTTALEERFERLTGQLSTGKLTRTALDEFVGSGLEMTRLVVRSTQRAAGLVNSFKQVATDQVSESRRNFDLYEVVVDLLATLGPGIERPLIRVINAVPPGLACDSYPGPLAQVIANLVQNALSHAFAQSDKGTVRIDARAHGASVLVTVSDDGVGINPQLQSRVFDPFFTTKLGQGGSGLGLAVCHRIVTAVLGGELKLVSELGKGSSFVIDIPAAAPGRI